MSAFSGISLVTFLPRCMECRRGLAVRMLNAVCPSVHLSVCSMTLNDLERRNSPYFAFSTEFDRFPGWLCISQWLKVDLYNVRKILSPSSSLLFLAKTTTHPTARSLCDSWASCILQRLQRFYSASALLAIQSAVKARGILSVCPMSVLRSHSSFMSRGMKIRSCSF